MKKRYNIFKQKTFFHKNDLFLYKNTERVGESVNHLSLSDIKEAPYKLTAQTLKNLEAQSSIISDKERAEWEDVFGYFLTIGTSNSDNLSQTIFQTLVDDCPNIYNSLNTFFVQNINKTVQKNQNQSEKRVPMSAQDEYIQHREAFLKMAESSDYLLPIHLKTLQSLQKEKDFHDFDRIQSINDTFTENLEKRMKTHSFSASDMDIILGDKGIIRDDEERTINTFRGKVDQILGIQNDEVPTYLKNKYDKYAPWISVPEKTERTDEEEEILKKLEQVFQKEKPTEKEEALQDGLVEYFGGIVNQVMNPNENTDRDHEDEMKTPEQEAELISSEQKEFQEKLNRFISLNSQLEQVVLNDIQIFDDNEFLNLYTVSKSKMKDQVLLSKTQREEVLLSWKEKMHEGNIQEWIRKYGSLVTAERTEGLNNIEELRGLHKDFDEKLKPMESGMKSAVKERTNKELWKQVQAWGGKGWYFYSISDVFTMLKSSFEMIQQMEKDRAEEAQNRLGKQFWEHVGQYVLPTAGKEISKNFKDNMGGVYGKRIKGFMEEYKRKQGWQIWEILGKSKSGNEMQACLNLLNDMGLLRFDNPLLWEAINRLKGTEYMKKSDLEELSLYEITNKVKEGLVGEKVCTAAEFDVWKKTKAGKRENALSEWVGDYDEVSQKGYQDGAMVSMLNQWASGNLEKADPARYLSYLVEAFNRGEMNGYPDKRMYYLIQGMVLKSPNGQTLIGLDEFEMILRKFMGKFPHLSFFKDDSSLKLNGKIVPEGTVGAEKRPWGYKDFIEWSRFLTDGEGTYDPTKNEGVKKRIEEFFDHYIHQSEMARGIVSRSFQGLMRDAEDDDAWMYFREWEPDQILAITKNNGKSKDFLRNFLSAFPGYMKSMHAYLELGDTNYAGSPEWAKRRKDILEEIGSRMKIALHGTQILAGNYLSDEERTNFNIFSQEEWYKKNNLSPSLQESRNTINDCMEGFIDLYEKKKGVSLGSLRKVLTYNGYEHGDVGIILYNYKEGLGWYANEANPKHPDYNPAYDKERKIYQEVERTNIDLFHGNRTGMTDMFQDTEVIELALESYIQKLK